MTMRDKPSEADIVGRAIGLLKAFFRANPDLQGTVLDEAFGGCAKDPRGLLRPGVEPDTFAVDCVTKLLGFGCTDGHRHSLSRLLTVIREQYVGANPPPDFGELPPLLDVDCAVPTREEELAYLARLLADIRAKARKYSALRAVGELNTASTSGEALDEDLDEADIALLRLERAIERESRDFEDILQAFAQVQTAALLGAPGAGKSTTLRRLAADLAKKAQSDPAAPLPLFVALGEWTGAEPFGHLHRGTRPGDWLRTGGPGAGWAARPAARRAE